MTPLAQSRGATVKGPVTTLIAHFFSFVRDIWANRSLIVTLAGRDIKSRYLGSAFGFVWAFVQPTVTIFVMWFVFQFGLKSPPIEDAPFSLWLIAGMIPWFFFSECLSGGTYSVLEHHYLVKHVSVRLSILPIVKVITGLTIHVFLVALALCVFLGHGVSIGVHATQLVYYSFAAVVLLLGLSWMTSSLVLFVRDVGQAVSIALQLGFWFTPIVWNYTLTPERLHWILKLNPVLYLVEGYRDALIYKVWFWEKPALTAYYWAVAGLAFCLGAVLFRRLRPHFADII
jgi:lipopolysaccharide transport system permease protein/teichoic acid transport system permease protein